MALVQQIANYDELVVGANHPNLVDTHSRAYLKDHDQYGAHTKISYSNLVNNDGSTLSSGTVVVIDPTLSLGYKRTTTAASLLKVLVVEDSIINGGTGYVADFGYVGDLQVQGAVAIGDFLGTSTTTGRGGSLAAGGATVSPPSGTFAIAMTANASGAGTVKALLLGVTIGAQQQLTQVWSDDTEHTTTSTSYVTLASLGSLSIATTSILRILGNGRKTAGAASTADLGLLLNANKLNMNLSASDFFGSQNAAYSGAFEAIIGVRAANYTLSAFMVRSSATATNFAAPAIGTINNSNDSVPTAVLTTIGVIGLTNSASQTVAVANIRAYTM